MYLPGHTRHSWSIGVSASFIIPLDWMFRGEDPPWAAPKSIPQYHSTAGDVRMGFGMKSAHQT